MNLDSAKMQVQAVVAKVKSMLSKEVVIAAVVGFVLGMAIGNASAAPIAVGGNETIQVTIYDEPCKLAGAPKNLTNRATWKEAGKITEGCVAPFGPVVGGYFADKTMVVMPSASFRPVSEI